MSSTPTPYNRQSSFVGFQTSDAPTVGQSLEAEFNKIDLALDETQARLAEIQRDDGELKNESVHPDALSQDVRAILAARNGVIRGSWASSTQYAIGDVVSNAGVTYIAALAHTSTADFNVDLVSGRWLQISGVTLGGGPISIGDVTGLTTALDGKAATTSPFIIASADPALPNSFALQGRSGDINVSLSTLAKTAELSLPSVGVSPGTYTNATVTVDSRGRVTSAASGAGGGGGEINTASNLGAGFGLFAGKVGVDLQFKSLVAGSGVSLSQTATTVTVSFSGTANVADGNKGDITVSGVGATWAINNAAVTYAKMQAVSNSSRLLGRWNSGSGNVEEIQIGSGLSAAGGVLQVTSGGSIPTVLDNLADVVISAPGDGQVVRYNSAFSRWENSSISVGDIANFRPFYYTEPTSSNAFDGDVMQWDSNLSLYVNEAIRTPVFALAASTVTIGRTHAGKIIRSTNAGGLSITLPLDSYNEGEAGNEGRPGQRYLVFQDQSGGVSIAGDVGVTVNFTNTTSTSNSFGQLIEVFRIASNRYVVSRINSSGGSGAVSSVNGSTGAVVLTGTDINSTAGGSGSINRTVSQRINDSWYNVKDFGAVGNGSTDDSTAVQSALTAAAATGGTVFVPAGTYQVQGLTIASSVRLLGTGQGSILRAVAGMGTTTVIIRNATQGSFANSNITVEAITFDGNGVSLGGSQTRLTELVSFSRVTGLKVRGVTVTNTSYIGMACGGCIDVEITNSSFTACGFDGTTSNGGPALWIATTGGDTPLGVSVTNCVFRDNRWSGLHFSVDTGTITGCAFKNNKEAHIFGSTLAGVSGMSNVAIVGNSFETVTQKDISGSAIELGGYNLSITGNTILDCAHNGIALTDCQRVTVTGNTIGDFNKAITPNAAGITIITTASAGSQPRTTSITGNTIYDLTGTGYAAILVGGGGAAVSGITITNNNVNGSWSSGVPIFRAAGKWGANSFNANNNGAQDGFPVATTWQPGTGTGNVSFTGLQFRPRRLTVKALVPSTTKLISSTSESNVSGTPGTFNCQSFSAGTAGAHSGERGAFVYDLYDVDGTTSLGRASFVSFDETGFTINRTVSTSSATVLQILAYP